MTCGLASNPFSKRPKIYDQVSAKSLRVRRRSPRSRRATILWDERALRTPTVSRSLVPRRPPSPVPGAAPDRLAQQLADAEIRLTDGRDRQFLTRPDVPDGAGLALLTCRTCRSRAAPRSGPAEGLRAHRHARGEHVAHDALAEPGLARNFAYDACHVRRPSECSERLVHHALSEISPMRVRSCCRTSSHCTNPSSHGLNHGDGRRTGASTTRVAPDGALRTTQGQDRHFQSSSSKSSVFAEPRTAAVSRTRQSALDAPARIEALVDCGNAQRAAPMARASADDLTPSRT